MDSFNHQSIHSVKYNFVDSSKYQNLPQVSILGVDITNISMQEALEILETALNSQATTHTFFLVNAHTINLAKKNPTYRQTLNNSYMRFGDGIGVRLAAKLESHTMQDNLAGTDLIPKLLQSRANRGYRYFLLGGSEEIIQSAAQTSSSKFPGWNLVGYHSGYFSQSETGEIIQKINNEQPHMLLVGMGNPLQEYWLDEYADQLKVPLTIGVGGLFHYWAEDLARAPIWMRQAGLEWLGILIQQPHKWRRYILGNPSFLLSIYINFLRKEGLILRDFAAKKIYSSRTEQTSSTRKKVQ